MDSSQDNRGPEIVALMVTFLCLTIISVSLRFFVRLRITKEFKGDDWLMGVSLFVFILYGAFILAAVRFGMGKHNKSLSQEDEIQALKYQSLATATYIANMAFIKLSIAVFLLRIAVHKRYQWILRISMAIVAIWTAGIFFFDVFECKPVEFQWDYTIQGGTCVSGDSLVNAAYAFSVLSVLSDWLYALLPIPMLWSVRMNQQTKIAVIGILSLGIFASVATLIRIKYLIDVGLADDILYASTDTMIWTIVEPGLGITAASAVTLRPLLRACKIPGFSSNNSSEAYANARNVKPSIRAGDNGIQNLEAGRSYNQGQELDMEDMLNHSRVLANGSSSKMPSVVKPYPRSDNGSQDFILQPSESLSRPATSAKSQL